MQDNSVASEMPFSPQLYMVVCAIKIALFVPWCFAVGGAILLYPKYLDVITFKMGYKSPPELAARFAFWANEAWYFIVIFLGIVASIAWYNPARGITIFAMALVRCFCVWGNFEFDSSVPLGQDDRQSIYMGLVMKDRGLGKDTIVHSRSEDGIIRRSTIVTSKVTRL